MPEIDLNSFSHEKKWEENKVTEETNNVKDYQNNPLQKNDEAKNSSNNLEQVSTNIEEQIYQKGKELDETNNIMADGSIVRGTRVRLRNVSIGDLNCGDLWATVVDNPNAPMLLGNNALKSVVSFTIDEENKEIIFKTK